MFLFVGFYAKRRYSLAERGIPQAVCELAAPSLCPMSAYVRCALRASLCCVRMAAEFVRPRVTTTKKDTSNEVSWERNKKRGRIRLALQGFPRGNGESGIRTPMPHRFARVRSDSPHGVTKQQKKTPPKLVVFFVGDPWENRTPVSALRGPCLSRLTNGPWLIARLFYHIFLRLSILFSTFFSQI